jgi:hypothetical protein
MAAGSAARADPAPARPFSYGRLVHQFVPGAPWGAAPQATPTGIEQLRHAAGHANQRRAVMVPELPVRWGEQER